MKRRELIRHLTAQGCVLVREGSDHSWWGNPATTTAPPSRATPRSIASSLAKSAATWESRGLDRMDSASLQNLLKRLCKVMWEA